MWHRMGKGGEKVWGKRGAGIVYTDGNTILLLKRSDKGDNGGKWGVPGGKSEEEETYLGTAQRETREEIGCLPHARRIGSLDNINGRHHFRTYICLVPKRFSCNLSDEHDMWDWFDIQDLQHVDLHEKLKGVLNDIVDVIKHKSGGRHIQNEMSGFAEYVSLAEVGGATGDLHAGYTKGGPDYQVEGDPSSMFPQKREKKKRKRSRK